MTEPHELTLAAVDPETDWGDVSATCSVCGPIGAFHSAVAAYAKHGRNGKPEHPPPTYAGFCQARMTPYALD